MSPGSVSFGVVTVGSSSTKTVTLTNSATTSITISSVKATGAGFSQSGMTMPLTLAAGRSALLTVRCVPTVAGTMTGSIAISSNASNPLVSIALTGLGVRQLSASKSTMPLGTVAIGNTKVQSVSLTNYGSTSISISKVTVAGTGFSESGLAAPLTLAAKQSYTFSVRFAPSVLGAVTGSVTVASTAYNPVMTIALSGLGVRQLSASRSTILFGSVAVGTTSAQSVSLTNYGTTSLTISKVAVSGTGFSESGLVAPLTIAAGKSFTFSARFAPTAAGTATGSIAVTSNAFDPLFTMSLSGSGTGSSGSLAATPSSVSFGKVVTGQTNTQSIRISNTGRSSVTISKAAVTGTGFKISGLTVPLTIAAGGSATFNAAFAPTVVASESGSISIVSNASNPTLTLPLSGAGVAASVLLGVNPTSLSFGSVNVNSSSSLNVTLTNTGNSNVTLSSVVVSGAGFSKSGAAAGLTLTPAQTAALTVAFTPAAAGAVTGSVSIASNATNSPAKVSLSATGAVSSSHSVTLSWDASTSSEVAGYHVYRGTVSGGPYSILTSSAVSVTEYTDSSVQAGHVYYYVVRSVDSSGVESTNSSQVSATIPSP
ncbi:MAG: choice-of-anchor D domain-containing protein [Candidatus Acidiferrales bacterium]